MLLFGTLYWRTGAGIPTPPPPPAPDAERPRGRAAWLLDYRDERRTQEDIRRARERFGITDEAAAAIREVALRQAERLEQDAQKRFEELERERLISEEIALRIRKIQNDEEVILMLLMAAAVVAKGDL